MSVSEHTAAHQHAVTMDLPFDDEQDFVDAQRGFLAALDDTLIEATDGRVVWDLGPYGDTSGDAPATVNPSLWRQAQLNLIHGLFEVVPGIKRSLTPTRMWQSVMTLAFRSLLQISHRVGGHRAQRSTTYFTNSMPTMSIASFLFKQ